LNTSLWRVVVEPDMAAVALAVIELPLGLL